MYLDLHKYTYTLYILYVYEISQPRKRTPLFSMTFCHFLGNLSIPPCEYLGFVMKNISNVQNVFYSYFKVLFSFENVVQTRRCEHLLAPSRRIIHIKWIHTRCHFSNIFDINTGFPSPGSYSMSNC